MDTTLGLDEEKEPLFIHILQRQAAAAGAAGEL